jgi:predicted transport protein
MAQHTTRPRPDKIPIIVDTPREDPGLDFDRYVDGLAGAVRGGVPARYTIGLYGAWGTGKSSILASLEKKLKAAPEELYVVHFDAWRYEKYDNIIFPLLYSVKKAITKTAAEKGKAIGAALGGLLRNLEVSFMGVGLRLERDEVSDTEAYTMPFSQLQALSDGIGRDKRIVVLVDDLDRCSPSSVVNLLEAIHVLTDVEGFVFVLALDYNFLTMAINDRYENVDADQFIEKIIQVPFRIPALDGSADTLLEAVVPEWQSIKEVWFDQLDEDLVARMIDSALRSNPRQVKRLINSLLMTKHIAWGSETADDLLVKLIALQLRWPQRFAELHRTLAVAASDERGDLVLGDVALLSPLFALDSSANDPEDEGEDDEGFAEFLGEFFTQDASVHEVLRGMKLTAATTQADPVTPPERELSHFEKRLAAAPPAFRDLVLLLENYIRDVGVDVEQRDTNIYKSFGRPRSFASINVVPRRGVFLYLPLPLDKDDLSRDYVRDVSNIGHHGNGDFEIKLLPGESDRIEFAKRAILRSYEHASESRRGAR